MGARLGAGPTSAPPAPRPKRLDSQSFLGQCPCHAHDLSEAVTGHARVVSQLLVALSLLVVGMQRSSHSAVAIDGCTWTSEVTPDALIRLGPVVAFNTQTGGLFYKGNQLMGFQHAQAMGYGSHVWSVHDQDIPKQVIVFTGNQVLRAIPGRLIPGHPEPRRVIIVGLGSSLWYGSTADWRADPKLLAAGEGFWRVSKQCPSFIRMSDAYDG
jgi:hypothetical protein